jgi:hypothetical protein
MELRTREGLTLVNLDAYNEALHRLKSVSEGVLPLRTALLNDMRLIEAQHQNSIAKSIRLLDKMIKMLNTLENL